MQKSSKKSRKGLLSGSLALDPVFEGSRNMGLGFQIVSDTFSGKDTFPNNFPRSDEETYFEIENRR